MLTITIPALEFFNERTQEFEKTDETTIELEHSLASLSKWESKWEKPFLSPHEKTTEETLSYIKDMTITPDIPPEAYERLSIENLNAVNKYIDAKMSATWFSDQPDKGRKEVVTAEIIYYWMIAQQIPFECQYWHLNRLLTLVKVVNQKNSPPKKMSRQEVVARQRALNEQRKAQLNTKG